MGNKNVKRIKVKKTDETPYFIGNDILVHNSCYFSVYEAMKKQGIEMKETKEEMIELYDGIANTVNNTFPQMMHSSFNTGLDKGAIIAAGRENLSDYGLFIKKKRYAMRIFDDDGRRVDYNKEGEYIGGKMKYMGIEVKRSDTPVAVQNVLKQGLEMLLNGQPEDDVIPIFIDFKIKCTKTEPWLLGRPSGANAVSHYTKLYTAYMQGESRLKPRIPGAISGAMAFNDLLELHDEGHIQPIGDGSKVINCKLKPNAYGYKSISYPTDMTHFPEWFKKLPFDINGTIESNFFKKVENIFGVLGWHLDIIKASNVIHKNFEEDDY